MIKYKNIYVAATNQHVGKTTSTLGLVSSMLQKNVNVGYCKPVGQKFLDLKNLYVDKDTLLFADLIKFEINPDYHSPVVLPGKVVRDFISEPKNLDFYDRVANASKVLNKYHELTIFEGTGHPGVGSVVGLSNAEVAHALDAAVVMIVEGGIGSTIDMFHMCSAVFEKRGVPIIGVIINKIRPDKMEQVKFYLSRYFGSIDVPVLGYVPYDKNLAHPLMSTVCNSIKGVVAANSHCLYTNRVENILSGSSVDLKELKEYRNNLIVTSARTMDRAVSRVDNFATANDLPQSSVSGVIVTGEGDISQEVIDFVNKYDVPLIRTIFDTFGVVINISKIEVKINRQTPWKIQRAIELISKNVDLNKILIPADKSHS